MATAPFGYKNARDGSNKPKIIKTDKATLVQEAFELYATGCYEKEEVRKKLRPNGMTLSKMPFTQMLSNPLYCGNIRVPAYKDEPEEIVMGIHEPIVSKELFEQVQLVAFKRKQVKNKPKKREESRPLRGALKCSKCGKNLTGSASKENGGTYYYYHCQNGCTERFRAGIA